MAEEHPARAAAQRSMEYVHAKKREDWVANFADDGHIEDPIGKSMLDPSGQGHRGKAAIAAFWDRVIAPNRVLFDIMRSLRDRTNLVFAANSAGRAREDWKEHAAILSAVIEGDEELAALLATRHVLNAAAARLG